MELTALVDNTRLDNRPDLAVERGLSLHVNTMGRQILFDAGSGKAFCDNAALLDIEIQNVDAAVISHRHHDHCNGITHFLDTNSKARVYFRECEETDYYFKAFFFKSNVGIDKALLDNTQTRFTFINDTTEILPNIFVVTNISDRYQKPKGNKYLFTNSRRGCKPDRFDHELLLIIKESDGLVIFTGCAHSGVLNMVETAVELFPNTRIKAVVGGFHLVGLPIFNSIGGTKEEVEAVGRKLQSYPIDKLYTGHCTGMKAYRLLKGVLGDRLEHLPTGRSVVI
ncbi:MBL fold metallo-hydrolase [Vibrio furnissii]|uniref:MBL fold metallo-hydrolase n=1 Tax=Vibrio furnissii TaxID=29494 RepID=UPI0001B92C6D|nr:MBL fold metallo-hydrolase [Vibrio furnissii]EEX41156.1 metal dependent hydrolase [Vibrio furnissii CIP 102972]QDC93544.1 MBL fold metallo-hydrolase [Vibrio furnissii]UON47826.1 MBL fold metallo-hydrolase [Vibrio furnissii]SUP45999.1 ribonuclease Z [Vibrio furnissii]